MKVIISPAKTMKKISLNQDLSLPYFIEDTKVLVKRLQTLKPEAIMTMMGVNLKIAELTQERFQHFSFDQQGTPAIFAYDGLQFKNMALTTIKNLDYAYLNKTVKILSALYGVLNPLDSIYEYRLDMNSPFKYLNLKSSSDFWGDRVYRRIIAAQPNEIVINLASTEYSKMIAKYMAKNNFITCKFQQLDKTGKLKTNSTHSKKMRGAMVNYMLKNKITDPLALQKFNHDNHKFNATLSTANEWVFTN